MKITKRLFAVAFAILATSSLFAQEQWIDITDSYVKNPRYDNNDYSYWEGTPLGYAGPKENAEHYSKVYDTYQVITGLTAGKYRVSLSAFYRMGDSNNDYSIYSSGNYADSQYAKLYATSSAGDFEVGIVPASSGKSKTSLGGGTSTVGNWWTGDTYFIPNNMEAAYYWFNAGYYNNTLECTVGDDGQLKIGIRKSYTIGSDWTCIDNWKLEYYGTVKKVTSITLAESSFTMTEDEQKTLTYTCAPSDASYKKVTWSSSDESIATVDDNGVVTALKGGTVTITATAVDGSGVTASCTITVKGSATPSASNIVINELMASNIDVYRDPSTNFGSWVELYNPSAQGVKLGGLYVSDDPNNLKKHQLLSDYGVLPAKGYAILNFDHHEVWTKESYRQIDDKLDADGGTIIISDGTNIIAQQDYPEAIGRVSYARTTDGGSTWGNTGTPTPGAANNGGFATAQLDAPVVDQKGCLFSGTLNINVDIPAGATLKYTTDGTAPTLTNGEVSENGSFTVSNTTCYRFRLFLDGLLPSKVVTCSYIKNNGNEPFPIISVVTDKNNIDGSSDYGVFMQGQYGRPGNGQTSKCNWNMDWDRPVNFEYITTDNECVVSQECDFQMCGGWSRAWTPHSFKLKATKTYDLQGTFDYQFFDEKPYLHNKTLQIRNGGNDNDCRIKDAAVQEIAARSGIYVDYQSWQPVHVYINGNSYAVINMREPNNKHYGYANYGIDTDEMEQFEISPDSGYVQMVGTGEYYDKWYDLSADAANENVYNEICKLVDIDEYINYMAIELYSGGTDWPQNNVKGFRDLNDGKFHFVLFDMDFALNTSEPLNTFANKKNYTFDSLHGFNYSTNASIEGNRNYKEITFVTIFLNMLKNETFKKKFIDTFCLVGGSVYTPERVKSIVTEMSNYLGSGGYVYPSGTASSLISGFSNRLSTMINHIKSYLSLSSTPQQTVTLASDVDGAQILVNDIEVPTGKFNGTLFAPITLKAVAPAGYIFAGWSGSGAGDEISTSIFAKGSTWCYADTDISDTSWKNNVSSFAGSGDAPLGYNSSNSMKTSLTKNQMTYYFGKTLTLDAAPASTDRFTLNYTVDDGFVIYVNGTEAGRYQMPSGDITNSTTATTYAQGNPDTGSLTLDASLFKKGANYIAVEVHNNQTSSSDIYWDAELVQVSKKEVPESEYVSTDAEYTITSAGTYNLTACYKPMDADSLIAKGTTPVKINEISAANTTAYNDLFKAKDWIELYNTTDEDIDVAGMYLSDDEENPKKFQIPAGVINTVIEPFGHLVIWADGKDGVSQLHASFKLANDPDSKVILTSEDESWNDVMTYTEHLGTQSVGLYPDGSNNVYVMDTPTIGAQNTIDSYASFYMYYVPVVKPEPKPDVIADVPADATGETYYSVSGAYMGTSREGLPAGIYVVKYSHADGTATSRKVLVK